MGWMESLALAGDDGGGDGGDVGEWLSMEVEGMTGTHSPYYSDEDGDGVKDYVDDYEVLLMWRKKEKKMRKIRKMERTGSLP